MVPSFSSLEAICLASRDVPFANFLIAHGDLGPFDLGDRSYKSTFIPETIGNKYKYSYLPNKWVRHN